MTARLRQADAGGRVVRIMDFTPEDMEAVQACLDGIDRNVPVSVEPAAAALLLPHAARSLLIRCNWMASPAGAGASPGERWGVLSPCLGCR